MNIEEVKSKIEVLENYDLTNCRTNISIKKFQSIFGDLLSEFNHFPINNFCYENKIFTRCIINEVKSTEFKIGRIWYPKEVKYHKFGRLSSVGFPMLYSADSPKTSLFEIQPKKGDWITVLSFSVNSHQAQITEFLEVNLTQNMFDEKFSLFYEYLIKQFKLKVSKNKEQFYLPTFLLSKCVETNCIVYQSVATKYDGYNFAFKPKFIDNNWSFISTRIVEVLSEDSIAEEYFVRCLYDSDKLENEEFTWNKVNHCDGHLISINNYH